jgi:succinate-semialdehyde dehydrogenase/glutarate-semialdehyde dehydrogenase
MFYAYSHSAKIAVGPGSAVESGMMSIDHMGLSLPGTPFGGLEDLAWASRVVPKASLNTYQQSSSR